MSPKRICRIVARLFIWVLVPTLLTGLCLAQDQSASKLPAGKSGKRQIAITFDDLPANCTDQTFQVRKEITRKLLAALDRTDVKTIGFVNENKVTDGGEPLPERVALLEQWLDAGHDLGNHSYSHPYFFKTPLEEFQKDVLRGETITRPLMASKEKQLTFFRHPFLNTGPDLETKEAFEKFLDKHGYRVAPVTVDNSEWIFARAYDNALDRDDQEMVKKIVSAYHPYMEAMLAYYEQQSEALLGYEMKQILLLHANRLNADTFDDQVRMMKERGYFFISLEEALEDPAFKMADRYTGKSGITWLHRWALTAGKKGDFFKGEPVVPEFVKKEAEVDQQ